MVHRDSEAECAVGGRRFGEAALVAAFAFEDLEHHALGRKPVVAHELHEIAAVAVVIDHGRGMHVEEKLAPARIDLRVTAKVQSAADPVEARAAGTIPRFEQRARAQHGAVFRLRAQERLVADGRATFHAIKRLEMGRERDAVDLECCAAGRRHDFPRDVAERRPCARRHRPCSHDCFLGWPATAGLASTLPERFSRRVTGE